MTNAKITAMSATMQAVIAAMNIRATGYLPLVRASCIEKNLVAPIRSSTSDREIAVAPKGRAYLWVAAEDRGESGDLLEETAKSWTMATPTEVTTREPHPHSFQKTYGSRSNESRKLLAHVLRQLANRVMPPSVYDIATATDQIGEKGLSRLLKGGVKLGSGKPQGSRVPGDEDENAEVDRDFTPDATFDIMSQLKDVLMISVLRGWQIFDEGSTDVKAERQHSGKSSSPFRRSINTLNPSGKRSRSPSPASPAANFGGQVRSTELLSQCISILSFRAFPRPSRPPNALQALTLKVAQFLLHVHRRNPKVVSQIGFALIPAFYTFPPEMYARLLAFFEECIIRGILDDLREVQGLQDEISFHAPEAFDESLEAPMVSIRVDVAEDESDMSHHTKPKWAPWTDTVSPRVLSILSTNAPLQPPSVYFLASMTPPLLAAILDNITLLLITLRNPDTPAASMLSAFWPKGMGHVIISRPLASSAYLANSPSMRDLLQDHPYDHQFLPWRFIPSPRYPHNDCRSCSSPIDGFGLLCPFCTCAVHFDCYDHLNGCHLAKYSHNKVALYRFSYLSSNRRDHGVWTLRKRGHTFRYQPMWGCTSCLQFVHVRWCHYHEYDSSHMIIEWNTLRQTCIDFYEDILSFFEEASIMASLLNNGVALGSILITHNVAEFELHRVLQACEDLISQEDYLQGNGMQRSEHPICSIESPDHPFEMLPLSHLRDVLGRDFDLHSDAIAKYLLSYLHHLGHPTLFDDNPNVNSISSCLSDLDLSVNETGFLLLSRRLWPNGMASEYAVRRLTQAIISWVFAEDDNLAMILRDYVAKQQSLPGVRMADDVNPWPEARTLRHVPPSSIHNGGDYVTARRLAQTSPSADQLAAPSPDFPSPKSADVVTHNFDAQYFDRLLRLIIRLSQNLVTFTIFDDLFVRWLEAVSASDRFEEPIPSLSRLFARDVQESTSRASVFDSTAGQDSNDATIDPWRRVISVSTENKAGLLRSLRWIYVFARSGVDVPIQTYFHFTTLMEKFQTTVTESLLFVKTVMSSTWQRPTSRFEIQDMFGKLHTRLMPEVLQTLSGGTHIKDVLDFIRQTLATCLLLYGCNRTKVVEMEMIYNDEVKDLPSRRKINVRSSIVSDPIIVPSNFMAAVNRYMSADVDDVSCLIAKFFHMFLMRSPYLEPHEVDNFILKNGNMLCNCAWQLYGIRRSEISAFRAPFLLRTLVVDTQPFQHTLRRVFSAEDDWELRFYSSSSLCDILTHTCTSQVEGRQWKSSVSDVFYYFFTSLWADKKEEIRLSVDTLVSNMLAVHFNAISSCWDEVLSKSPIEERVKLVSFLIQLRSHFPTWKVVSWEVIIEILLEDQYDEKESGDGPAAAHLADPSDTALLRASILHLSLSMIAGGIKIEYNDVLRIKHHLVRAFGFDKVSLAPAANGHTFFVEFGEAEEIPELAYPCVTELTVVLDAHHILNLNSLSTGIQEGADSTTPLLIGAPYVDVCLGLFCTVRDLQSLPVLVLKSMIEALGIVIYKHNFEKVYLRHLQQTLRRAVSRALELLLLDINYECRQLALSVVQAYIKRWHGSIRSFVHFAIEQVAKLIASQSHLSQDALVAQGKAFIESTLVTYCNNGIFTGLIRRDLDPEVFVILKQVADANAKASPKPISDLRESLLRDTLPRAVETDQAAFQALLKNLQSFIEVVYHQGYSLDLISEWASNAINPSPLLSIATILIQHNKSQSRDMLTYTDAILRITLTRLAVDKTCLSKLIQVTATLYRKTQSTDSVPSNAIIAVVLELLSDGLRMKVRVLPITLKAMLEAVMTTEIGGHTTPAVLYHQQFASIADNGFHFLQNHVWTDVRSDSDYSASLTVGKFILQAATYDPSVMSRVIEQTVERSSRHYMTIRAWNMLVLSALMDPSESWITLMYMQLPTFSSAYQATLREYLQAGTSPPESAITDINHAYVAIKLWLMLAQKRAVKEDGGSISAFMVWNELWPPFESLVNVFEAEVQVGLSMTLAMLTWSTVAELFLFIRALHSPVASESASHIGLVKRLKNLGRGEAHTSKLSRALRNMSEPPPEIPIGSHINQAAKDLIAAEKLRILEARREPRSGRSAT
ncbi:uncharacterized protein EV420DRAFT_1620288 [Desarmillaria tabescens]|uniref:Phorbol-ester/DAG-type domain-containing protein n=1 Tax=Armillaria tabescens TaxID=1929756 RepID=A0AA39KEZ8_ARMTA|nr:uncharacterized protein EV420DRAFT_1620288 [Desarmillaria tabescens]KAK0459777.1 hypothetical protein EV420DRAFT_1620288 [Desarmillaria tabescens]